MLEIGFEDSFSVEDLASLLFPQTTHLHFNAFKEHYGVNFVDADIAERMRCEIERRIKEIFAKDRYHMNQRHLFAMLFEFLPDIVYGEEMTKQKVKLVLDEFLQSSLGGRILSKLDSADEKNAQKVSKIESTIS